MRGNDSHTAKAFTSPVPCDHLRVISALILFRAFVDTSSLHHNSDITEKV